MQEHEKNQMVLETIAALQKLLNISTIAPKNPDGSDKIINSVDVANGEPDNWVRKAKFTATSGILEMSRMMGIITDPILKQRIEDFRDYCASKDFVSKNKTTPEEIAMAITLIKDTLLYLGVQK